jgi:predicted transcriptional regulator of viral defense system
MQVEILWSILENERVTQQELSDLVGISPRNIRKNMDVLKSKGLLKRIGPQKGGRWKVIPHAASAIMGDGAFVAFCQGLILQNGIQSERDGVRAN